MTNVLRKKLACFEWKVKRPGYYNDSTLSDTFLFQGHKCRLKYLTGNGKGNFDYLYFTGDEQVIWPISFTVCFNLRANFISQTKTIRSFDEEICKLPDKELSNYVTLDVIIHVLDSKEDKSTQTASYLISEISNESLPEDFSNLLNTGLNYDIEIKCGEHSLKAHKIILCSRSDVFKKMLQSDMRESRTGIINLKDMDSNYFQDFVKYLYTGTLQEINLEKAKAFYQFGDKFAIQSLVVRCLEYFQDNISKTNAFELFALADAHSDQKLKDSIITYVLDKKVYQEEEYWLPFYENFPNVALQVYRSSYKNQM